MAKNVISCHATLILLEECQPVPMQTMNISLPDQLKAFVDHQVGSGRYSSVSEYIRNLIRDDERRAAQEKLEVLLVEGIQSGDRTEMTRLDWDDIRKQAIGQLESRRSSRNSSAQNRSRKTG